MSLRARCGCWSYRFKVQGRTITGATKLEATERNRKTALEMERKAKQAELAHIAISTGRDDQAGTGIDFATAAGKFINWCMNVRYRPHPNSGKRVRGSFTSLMMHLGELRVFEITAGRIEEFKSWRFETGVKDVTVRHDLHALSLFFKYAQKMGWAHSNPVREVVIPSDRDAVRENILSPGQEQKYFAAAALRLDRFKLKTLHDVGRVMIQQGCRPEEVMSLRKDDLDLKERTIRIRKGKTPAANRVLALTDETAGILSARMAVEGVWLFPSDRRPGHHISTVRRAHGRVLDRTGLLFDIYDLRHTFATRMATDPQVKTDLPTLAKILGHANLRTVQRYLHPTSEAVRMAMDRYDAAMKRQWMRKVSG